MFTIHFGGSNFPPIFGKQHPNGSSGRETFSEALQSRHSLNDPMVSPLQASWVELWTPGGLEDGGDIAQQLHCMNDIYIYIYRSLTNMYHQKK